MNAPAAAPSARSRRLRSASMSFLGLVVVLVCIALANVLARRFDVRLDVTATKEHQLAPSTTSLLASLDGPYEIVLAGELSALDRSQYERVRDVLGQMTRASSFISVRFLDTTSADGHAQFESLIADLAARDRAILDLQSRAVRAAADRGLTTAEYLEAGLAPAITSIRDALPLDAATLKLREGLDARSAACRISAADLRAAATSINQPLANKVAGVEIPDTDLAAQAIRAVLSSVADQMSTIAKDMAAIAAATALPDGARASASGLVEPVEKARDAAATAADSLARLARPDVLRVARALSEGNAALVIGPQGKGLMAIELPQLFPPALRRESAADAGRRAENLVATAIGAINTPLRPIVVLMHGELGTGLVAQKGIVTRLVERLALRGIDVAEWPVVSQPDPPALTSFNPDGKRPVVYATIPPDSSLSKPRPTDPAGPERAAKLGAAIDKLAQQHAPLLISMYPSVLPSYGDTDPTTAVLTRFGLASDTGRPIMMDRLTPQGRIVETEQALRVTEGDHPIQRAIRGLPTLFLWPLGIAPAPTLPGSPAPVLTPLFEIPPESESWAESQWLNYWRLPRSERPLAPNPPAFDPARDSRKQPMVVGYAAELPAAGGSPRQRLVAIGSNRWFMDPITTPLVTVDGRTLAANPGNIELFEAAIYWLAGQDELIAQSPEARAVAMVQTLSPGAHRALRIAAIAGLPCLVLVAGALFRLLRG